MLVWVFAILYASLSNAHVRWTLFPFSRESPAIAFLFFQVAGLLPLHSRFAYNFSKNWSRQKNNFNINRCHFLILIRQIQALFVYCQTFLAGLRRPNEMANVKMAQNESIYLSMYQFSRWCVHFSEHWQRMLKIFFRKLVMCNGMQTHFSVQSSYKKWKENKLMKNCQTNKCKSNKIAWR